MLQLLLVMSYGNEGNLKRPIKKWTFWMHSSQKNMICHKQIIPTKLHFSLCWQLVKSIAVLPNVFLQYEELRSKIYQFSRRPAISDVFWCFFLDASRVTLIPGTFLVHSNFKSANKISSFIRLAAFFLM